MKMRIVGRTKFPVEVQLIESKCNVSVSREAAAAFKQVIGNHKLYEGTKILEVVEAVYRKGRQDGAAAAMAQIQKHIDATRGMIK